MALAPLTPHVAPAARTTAAYPHTRIGAGLFVRAFYRELNRAMTTGSTTRMLALGTAACQACKNFAGFIEDAHAKRQTIHGGRLTVRSAVAMPPTGNRIRVTTIVDESPERIVAAHGHVVYRGGAAPAVDNEVELIWADGWRVDRVTLFRQ